ncbi:SAC3 domain-containing protein 1 isoform X2 [Schistocerca serialis cubense]|uniref:SAC3 domain-containing protein 1 isoform X2 n=1 Tax=Schistocerca serialis cubense TaxID=2023355 RepID=UPI00214F1BAF|nr:SAC3 domain-containing protein 1 isoform X2 [Schistocerca serialis cubense]
MGRERNGLLHQLESVQMGKSESVTGNRRTIKSRWRADYKRVIKSFSRPAAGHGPPDPDDIRPPQVLLQTVKYLLSEVVPSQSLPWNEVYDFVFDRLRAVRQDLVIQGTPSVESVEILEPIARFLAYAGYRSCEEPASRFDAVIHRQHLLECVQRLLVLYDRKEQESGGSATGCDGRADTEALYLVLAPGSADALQRALQLPAAYRSDTVKSALEFSLACYSGNYVRALRRLPPLPPLLACLAALHVPHLRRWAACRHCRHCSPASPHYTCRTSAGPAGDECGLQQPHPALPEHCARRPLLGGQRGRSRGRVSALRAERRRRRRNIFRQEPFRPQCTSAYAGPPESSRPEAGCGRRHKIVAGRTCVIIWEAVSIKWHIGLRAKGQNM